MAYQLTAADLRVVDALHGAVYLLAQEVSSASGVGQPYPAILLFQKIWNSPESKVTVNNFARAGMLPSVWFKLVEDGLYGTNTGKALWYTTSTSTPAKTYGLVAWYAANNAQIASYADAARWLMGGSGASAVDAAKVEPTPQQIIAAAVALGQMAGSGSLYREAIPDYGNSSTPQGELVAKDSAAQGANDAQHAVIDGNAIGSSVVSQPGAVNEGTAPPQAIDAKIAVANEIAKIAPSGDNISFSDEPIIAQRVQRNTTVVAVGVGLLAALGIFGYMATRKTRRHA